MDKQNVFYKYSSIFICSVVGVFFVTGTAKIITAFSSVGVLKTYDPVFGFQLRTLFLIAGVLEIVGGMLCLLKARIGIKARIVAWLGTLLFTYRLAMVGLNYKQPCNCLGNLTDALHISPQTGDTVMKIILAYLLLGSYATLFWLWRQSKKAVPVSMQN